MAINPTTKPHSLTHISNLSWDDDNQLIVNEIVGVDPNGVVRKVPVTVDGKLEVSTAAPVGGATEAKQDSQITLETQISSLTETLQELVQRLAPLAGAMANTAQLRTVVTGAVTATGGGYVTSAQVIAALLTQTNTLRLDPNNTLAVLSNINNCVGA